MLDFKEDIEQCIKTLSEGKLILYPTDTIWGVGCDATNEEAIAKIFTLKKRADSKSVIILISNEKDLQDYVSEVPEMLNKIIANQKRPTTIIYEGGKNLAKNVLNADGSIAIRIVNDPFCAALIKEFGKPIVSTSANISGRPSPGNFREIADEIKNGVTYTVKHRRESLESGEPSAIIKIRKDGGFEVIR